MQYVLFNPQAGNGSGAQQARALDARFPEETFSYTDMTTISDYAAWLGTLPADASLIIAGGDGTLNRFLNDTNGMALPEKLYYFATGSGNDFLHDLGLEKGADPVPVAQHLRDLPTVTVNGKHWRFLNGIGYGIDGYCCEVGDALRGKSDKPVNYTAIAIKGLLFHFHPANAELVVRAVGDIGSIGGAALVRLEIVDDQADREAEEAIDLPHPFRVALGQIVVDPGRNCCHGRRQVYFAASGRASVFQR